MLALLNQINIYFIYNEHQENIPDSNLRISGYIQQFTHYYLNMKL